MTPKNKIVIATGNKGKAAEFKSIFEKFGFEIQTLLDYPELDEIDETGTLLLRSCITSKQKAYPKL